MTDLYLRFADRASFEAAGLQAEPGALDLDVIGVISLPTGEIEPMGGAIVAPIPGWHVNLRCSDGRDLSALATVTVHPAQPVRVWAAPAPLPPVTDS